MPIRRLQASLKSKVYRTKQGAEHDAEDVREDVIASDGDGKEKDDSREENGPRNTPRALVELLFTAADQSTGSESDSLSNA